MPLQQSWQDKWRLLIKLSPSGQTIMLWEPPSGACLNIDDDDNDDDDDDDNK